jgi:DUF4097 and DUF4098 domain-containing protein YvlB
MNRKNNALKLAGVLLAVGLALYFVSMAAFASDAPAHGGTVTELDYEQKDYTTDAAGIDQINIRARNMPVTVTPSKDGEITIHYYTCEKDPYEVTLEGGTLTLKYKYDNLFDIGSWFNGSTIFNVLNNTNPRVEVAVPEAYAGALTLDTSNASVNVSGLTAAGDVRMDTSNSSIEMSNVSATLVNADTSNGAVTLEKVIVSGTVDMRSSNGPLTARQVAAKDKLYLETSNGRVVVDQVTSAAIELKSSNGSISGSVGGKRSDYTISSDTSNADDNLGDGGKGPFRLTVNTSNGDINISFLDE